jgi:hypothetical protein
VTATGFEVRESGGGTSSLSFDYRIVAKRRGYEAQRLTDVTERFRAETARASHFQQIAKDAKASGKSKPGPLRLPGVPPSAVRAVHRAAKYFALRMASWPSPPRCAACLLSAS